MSTQAIERNYRKNPHTARFLQTFHSGIGSNGVNYRAELDDNAAEVELAASEDLLDAVPVAQGFTPSERQASYILDLVRKVTALDANLGEQATSYILRMDANKAWTRENVSRWIDSLKAKLAQLRTVAPAPTTAPATQVADGRYAVEEDGTLKFFKVKNGNRAGFVFLDIQASDDWHGIRDLGRIRRIVALIAQDPKAAMVRYGQELGECGHCGRTLTDEASRAAGIGPVCASK
jgi:uncharacterized protein DUF6011